VSKYHPYNDGYHGYGNSSLSGHVNPWYDTTSTTNNEGEDTTGWWSPY
jgi:hypothetical protein